MTLWPISKAGNENDPLSLGILNEIEESVLLPVRVDLPLKDASTAIVPQRVAILAETAKVTVIISAENKRMSPR